MQQSLVTVQVGSSRTSTQMTAQRASTLSVHNVYVNLIYSTPQTVASAEAHFQDLGIIALEEYDITTARLPARPR